ncbi:MAG: putative DCC family thiol-disulfide oxidoreductase YuxK [Candidatus Aldehydirespiratoraceae bacterium]
MAAQAHGVPGRTGLTVEQTDMAVWTVASDSQGDVFSAGGPRGVALMLAVAWNSSVPLLPWKFAGVPWLLDRTYEVIAANRYRFPGDTPWCVANGGDCVPRTPDSAA